MAKRRKRRKSRGSKRKAKRSVRIPGSVRKAKGIIKKHIARLQSEKKKQESSLSSTNRELRELKSL
jgi:hypothetical protein